QAASESRGMTNEDASGAGTGDSDDAAATPSADDLGGLLRNLQRLVDPRTAMRAAQGPVGAAWRGVTSEEPRVQVTAAVLVAIGLMVLLPERVANRPRWVLPGLAVLLLIGVFVAKSARSARRTRELRIASLALIAVITLSNATSAGRLIVDLVRREGIREPTQLLLTGAFIWFTNVIVFGIWYWEFDRGGPVERAAGSQPFPDFLFPQMTSPELARPDWEPGFIDYLYVSFTNATAFSPTDVMPMTRWTKLTMMLQSSISVITLALVIARAVNILQQP
ncbi:MAG: hypothetical protein QOG65_3172, partial [Actinomycetota bacterium]|nr:hypothetical protein [Actinomycetota bacterium]